jgi:hypothetical protein
MHECVLQSLGLARYVIDQILVLVCRQILFHAFEEKAAPTIHLAFLPRVEYKKQKARTLRRESERSRAIYSLFQAKMPHSDNTICFRKTYLFI